MILYSSVFLVIQLLSSSIASTKPNHPVLKYFELLHVSDLRHKTISKIPHSEEPWTRQIHFHSLGRSFSFHLEPRVNLFAPKFKIHLVNRTGHYEPYSLNTNRFYQGYLIGDNSSVVVSHLSETGLITAQINTHNETYYIEPAHYHFGESYFKHMIAYRKSEAQHSHLSGTVDYVVTPHPIIKVDHTQLSVSDSKDLKLLKRQQIVKDTCSMVVIADYRFFDFLRSSESNVIDTIVSRIDAADRLSFRPAQWIVNGNGDTITGRGLQIGAIIIHTEPSSDAANYNSIENSITIQDLLRRFSRNNWSDYCLAHLLTHRNFPSNKLGLAYIASPEIDETGGICSTRVLDAITSQIVTYNTGISIVSAGDRLLLPSEAELVIAHGHSWGSAHDPGNERQCAFDYLMNEFAQDGSNPKHREFSSCSLASIGRVIINKATCFKAKSISTCGNFVIDEGEECDEGGDLGSFQADGLQSCCTTDCLLMEGRNCSDVNHPCCIDCQIASVGSKVCHIVGNVSRDCTSLTTCNGIIRDCPEPNQAEVNSRCNDGICMFQDDTNTTVECVPFCKVVGMEKCSCIEENQCLECCLTKDGECEPLNFNGEIVSFPDGVFCSTGFCNEGVCVDGSQDFASQLWSVITALDINEYAQFIKENIIGFVLLIVTIIWVPGSCLFYYLCDVKKVWKRCLHRSVESPDNYYTTPIFETQSSWTQVKPELKPLLSVDDDDTPVEEPEDDLPLPKGFTDYSNESVMTFESTI